MIIDLNDNKTYDKANNNMNNGNNCNTSSIDMAQLSSARRCEHISYKYAYVYIYIYIYVYTHTV